MTFNQLELGDLFEVDRMVTMKVTNTEALYLSGRRASQTVRPPLSLRGFDSVRLLARRGELVALVLDSL